MNPIIPTVGRVVYFTPAAVDDQSIIPDWQSGVCAALVTAVHNENCVNLAVFDVSGNQYARCSVCHVSTVSADDDVKKYDTWDWMPYQKGKAAKTEQLEAKLGDAHQKPSLAYCQQTTPQQRVLLEKHDLDEKIEKLSAFLSKPKPDFVSEAQWGLMSLQIHHMKHYQEVLRDRLIDFGVIAEPLSPHNTINS